MSQWGARGEGPGTFFAITAIAADFGGNVYVADSRGQVEKFDAYGRFLKEWGSPGTGPGQFGTPLGLAATPSGEIYVTDTSNRVQVFDSEGRFLRQWKGRGAYGKGLSDPGAIAIDSRGSIYVVDRGNYRIVKFSSRGAVLASWGSKGDTPGQFRMPNGIAIGKDDHIYVSDYARGGVQVFSSGGKFLSHWLPGPGVVPEPIPIPSAKPETGPVRGMAAEVPRLTPELKSLLCESALHKPAAIAADRFGHIYVVNGVCDRVQRYDSDGRYLGGWWIAGGATHALGRATGIAASGDRIYVTELNGPTVRAFGHGLTRAESELLRFAAENPIMRLRLLTTLEMSEVAPPSSATWTLKPILAYEYLGFGDRPRLKSARYPIETRPVGPSDSVRLVQAALDAFVDEQLGIQTPAKRPSEHAKRGLRFRSELGRDSVGNPTIDFERVSAQFSISEASADSSDLRLLEGGVTQPDAIWESLIPAVWYRNGALGRALMEESLTSDSLLAVIRRASDPGSPAADRDLFLLTADQWLRSFGLIGPTRARLDPLGDRWQELGFRSESMNGQYAYCGSALKSLASRAGENRWTDRAFLILLDDGWSADCTGFPDEADFGNDVYVPVLAHGEKFLRDHKRSEAWPSVALRVALAHETVWSLSKDREQYDVDRLKAEAPRHRRRALELYRSLVGRTREPRLKRAIEGKIRSLELDRDTKCRVYYLEGEC